MEQLKQLYYSTSTGNSRSNSFKLLTWKFYDENNCLRNLEYKYTICNISTLNKVTRLRDEIKQENKQFYLSHTDTGHGSDLIKNIDEWLTHNMKYIKKSYDNCMKSFEIIDFIKSELGNYNYALPYEIGWSIKDFYKLYIDLYSTKITLNYKGKETQLSEQKVKTFIKKNKQLIIQAKENEHKKYIQRKNEIMEQERIKKLEEDTKQLNIDSKYDATRKVNYGSGKNLTNSFAILRTLKERYETQACKPFPEKYPWESS
jgi:hypothetical protein